MLPPVCLPRYWLVGRAGGSGQVNDYQLLVSEVADYSLSQFDSRTGYSLSLLALMQAIA